MPYLIVGEKLEGTCGGIFETHHEKIVEGVGFDWVVVRDEYGELFFAYDENGYGESWHNEVRLRSERRLI